jgi:hypothetical protein
MGDEAREARLLAVFNELPDDEKEAVLALVEKIGRKEAVFTCADQAGDANDKKQTFTEAVV